VADASPRRRALPCWMGCSCIGMGSWMDVPDDMVLTGGLDTSDLLVRGWTSTV
jgi:hypothetical protein